MNIFEILLISIGVSCDSCAVSICKGLTFKKFDLKKAVIIGLYFAILQTLFPILGYFLGHTFENIVTKVDHWIAFILLLLIGVNMIKEVFSKEESYTSDVSFKSMMGPAIATSIDAFALGITFALENTNIVYAAISILFCTFTLSVIGVKIGNEFGNKYKNKAQIAGGIILILIGIKTLLEHLGAL